MGFEHWLSPEKCTQPYSVVGNMNRICSGFEEQIQSGNSCSLFETLIGSMNFGSFLNILNIQEITWNWLHNKTFNFTFKIVQTWSFTVKEAIKCIQTLKLIGKKFKISPKVNLLCNDFRIWSSAWVGSTLATKTKYCCRPGNCSRIQLTHASKDSQQVCPGDKILRGSRLKNCWNCW